MAEESLREKGETSGGTMRSVSPAQVPGPFEAFPVPDIVGGDPIDRQERSAEKAESEGGVQSRHAQAWRQFVSNGRPPSGRASSARKTTTMEDGDETDETRAEAAKEVDWGNGVTWDMLAHELGSMQTVDELGDATDVVFKLVELDVAKASSKLGRLQKTAVILQTLESTPSRDRICAWVLDTMELRGGFRIHQVKALDRREFMVFFESEEDRDEMMLKPPNFIDGKLVRIINWGERQKEKLSPHLKPA
ncbi:hypothetical protein R1sor_005056 [Riccia sorocarpa]|uniref:DUF4283 domain-containing protein n=1 Tax=Riccia sorocarpa TaxID=122646 RepID=A0ABD3HM90_9MARC